MPPLLLTQGSMNLLEALEKYADKQLVLHCAANTEKLILMPLTLTISEAEFKENFPAFKRRWNDITFQDFLKLHGVFHLGVLVNKTEIKSLEHTYRGKNDLCIEWHKLDPLI